MAFTNVETLVATCAALPVAGIKRALPYRPRTVNAADLPLLYTRLPTSERAGETLSYGQGLRRATIEIVILTEMLLLNLPSANDALTVLLIDNLCLALESHADALGMDSYSVVTEENTMGDGATVVQAIVATVEVSG